MNPGSIFAKSYPNRKNMKLEVWVIGGLSVFLLMWYGIGYWFNLRRGRQIFHQLEEGLDVFGGEREAGWIGSAASGARINITQADLPFRQLELTLLLANRENPFLWVIDHLRGIKDRIIIKATLRSPCPGEISIVHHKKEISSQNPSQTWTWKEGPRGLFIANRGKKTKQQAKSIEPWLEEFGLYLNQFFWLKRDPHIQININMSALQETSSRAFFTKLKAIF